MNSENTIETKILKYIDSIQGNDSVSSLKRVFEGIKSKLNNKNTNTNAQWLIK